MMNRKSLFLVPLFLLTASLSQGDDITRGKRKIAVFPFEVNSTRTDDAILSAAFSDTLTSALAQVRALILTERGEIKRLLEEQKLGLSGIIDPQTAVKTGKILGVQTAVLGTYNRIGNKVRATCRFVDVASGEIDRMHMVKVYRDLVNEEDLFDVMEEVAKELIRTFDVKTTPEEIRQVVSRTDATKNYSAYEFYIKAMDKMYLFTVEGYEEAVPLFQKAIEVDPKYALGFAGLAHAYYYWGWRIESSGKPAQTYYDLCYENAQRAIKLQPDLCEARLALSFSYAVGTKVNTEKRIEESEKAVKLNPNSADAYYSLWVASGGDLEDPNLQKALALNPRHPAIHEQMGYYLLEKQRYPESITSYRKVLEINPRNYIAYYNWGVCLYNLSQGDEAILKYKKSIEIKPDYLAANLALGDSYYGKGLYDEAIYYYKKAKEIDPKNSAAHAWMGLCLYYKGDKYEAKPLIQKAMDLDPKNPHPYGFFGIMYQSTDAREANYYFEKSCNLGYEWACTQVKK